MGFGCIDTLRFQLDQPPHEDDLRDLEKAGFVHTGMVTTRPGKSGNHEGSERWTCKQTGLRVLAGLGRGTVHVEASLPRVLGLPNAEQETLTEGDAAQAIERMTRGVLPRTTDGAGSNRWGTSRIDLTRNFQGPVPEIVLAYSSMRHPQVRGSAEHFFLTGVGWYGTQRAMVIYDKAQERRDKEGEDYGEIGVSGRLEGRWLGTRGCLRLVNMYKNQGSPVIGGASIPVRYQSKLSGSERVSPVTVVDVPLSWSWLNGVLRDDLASIGRPEDAPVFRSLRAVALDALSTYPERYQYVYAQMSRSSAWRLRKDVSSYRREHIETTLENLIPWPDTAQVA